MHLEIKLSGFNHLGLRFNRDTSTGPLVAHILSDKGTRWFIVRATASAT